MGSVLTRTVAANLNLVQKRGAIPKMVCEANDGEPTLDPTISYPQG